MPTMLDVFISSKMVELKDEREALYKLLPTLNYGDIQLRAWLFDKDAPATEKSIRDVYLKGLRNSALYIGLFWNQYSKDDLTPNWTIDEFDRATEWGIERHIYVKDVEAEKRDVRLTEFINKHSDVKAGITAKWFKTETELSEAVRKSIAAWIQARQSHSTSPEAQLIRNPNDLRRPKKMFGREALLSQIDSLVDDGEKMLLQGAGGMGKTAVAGEATARFMTQTGKPVLWLTIGSGEAEVVFEALAQPAKMTKEVASASGEVKAQALKAAIRATGAGLVILDNAWNGAALHTTLNALPAELPVLVTSRQRFPLENVLEVGQLPPADSLGLLTYHNKRDTDLDAAELCKKLGYLAFALEVAGKTMKMKQWASAEMMQEIQEAPHRLERPMIYGEQEVISVQDLLTASLHALPDADTRQVFLTFGAFFASQLTPEMLQLYLEDATPTPTLPRVQGRELSTAHLSTLEQYGLAERIPAADNAVEHYQIHDLAYSYARAQNSDDQRHLALDACLAYTERYHEPKPENFAALRPELDNFMGAVSWAMSKGRYFDVEVFADRLNAGTLAGAGFMASQGYANHSVTLLSQAANAAEKQGLRDNQALHLSNLGNAYTRLGQIKRAIECQEQALSLSRELGVRQLEGDALGNLGGSYFLLGQYQKAIQYYQNALVISHQIDDTRGICAKLNGIGNAYLNLGQYDNAINHFDQSLNLSVQLKDRGSECKNLNALGTVYERLGRNKEALNYHSRALDRSREIGERYIEGESLGSLGIIYINLRQFSLAIKFCEEALEIADAINDQRSKGNRLGNLGLAYDGLGQHHRAIEFFQQALAIQHEIGDQQGQARQLGNLGTAYRNLGNVQEAIKYHHQSLELKLQLGDRRGEANSLGSLGDAYSDLQDYTRALEYYAEARKIYVDLGVIHQVLYVDQLSANVRSAQFGQVSNQRQPRVKGIPEFGSGVVNYQQLANQVLSAIQSGLTGIQASEVQESSSLQNDLMLAIEHMENNNYQGAASVSAKILSVDPNNRFALQIAAMASRKLGAATKATELWRLSLLAPLPRLPSTQESEILVRIGDLVARHQQSAYFTVDPEALAYANMGAELARAGDIKTAKEFFDKALQIDPNCELAHFNRGIMAYNSRQYQLVAECMKEVLRINPANQKAQNILSEVRGRF